MILRTITLLICVAAAPALEQTRAVEHLDKDGYDYYDVAWNFMGWSTTNNKAGYDYYDANGMYLGWSQSSSNERMEFYDSSGVHYRTVLFDATGGTVNMDGFDIVHNIGVPNYLGGADNYDEHNRLSNSGTGRDYVEYGDFSDELKALR